MKTMLFVSFWNNDNIVWATDILNLLEKRHLNSRVCRPALVKLYATVIWSEGLNWTV